MGETPGPMKPAAGVVTFVVLSALALSVFGGLSLLVGESESGGKPATVDFDLFLPLLVLSGIPGLLVAGLLPRLKNRWAPLWGIVGVGLAVRACFFLPDPFLSDDVYRYLWDGRVQLAGHTPYGIPPADLLMANVEGAWPEEERVGPRVNHPDIPTIYPPFLELLFWGVAAMGGSLFSWRAILLGVDLVIAALIGRVLKESGADRRLVVLYLWHPLPIVETIWSAHTEAVAIALLLAAIVGLGARRGWTGGILLGLGGAAKLLPWVMIPLAVRQLGWRPLVGAAIVVGAVVLPYATTDLRQAVQGMERYAREWYFNGMIFHPLGELLGLDVEDKKLVSTQAFRKVLVALFGVTCLVVSVRSTNAFRAGLVVTATFVVATPTLHPWYLLWVLPFAIVSFSRGWLLLSHSVLLAYVVQVGWREKGVWVDSGWVRFLEFTPPLCLLAWDALRRRRRGPAPVSSSATGESPGG